MKYLAAILLAILHVTPAFAGWPDARIVKIDGASGAFVQLGDRVVILSCAHRTNTTAVPVGTRCKFYCNDDSTGTAVCDAVAPFDLDSETISDVAIYTFEGQVNCKPFTISQRPLSPGETVWVSGFPQNRQSYWSRKTRVISDHGTLWIAGPSVGGESGGPIVNQYGELVGTLSATTSDGRTMCCGRATTAAFTANWCQNGNCCPPWGCPPRAIQQRPVQQAPQQAPKPQATPIPGPQGPKGDKGDPGPPGPAGTGGNCDCGPRWVEINAELVKLRAELADRCKPAKPSTINFLGDKGKVIATVLVTPGQTSDVTLPPSYIRVQDSRGAGYSTEYQPFRPGSYITLPFGPATN